MVTIEDYHNRDAPAHQVVLENVDVEKRETGGRTRYVARLSQMLPEVVNQLTPMKG